MYKHHFDDADFFMKADDDSYIIMENLRMMLKGYSPSDPVYFGCRFRLPGHKDAVFYLCVFNYYILLTSYFEQGYMSGGSGYVLSKEAVLRLVQIAFNDPDLCWQPDLENEDIEVGTCLNNVNVTAPDTRDSQLRGRFLPLGPLSHLNPGSDPKFWYWTYRWYGDKADVSIL